MIIKIQDVAKAVSSAGRFKKSGEKIVLAGGCFDILHIGHIKFLEAAKKLGDKLFILLESDEKVKKLKGEDRPVFNQKDRAEALSSIVDVDVIVKLPIMRSDEEYKELISGLQPDIVAVTENDTQLENKKIQIEFFGGMLKVIPYVASLSSSRLAEILRKEKHY